MTCEVRSRSRVSPVSITGPRSFSLDQVCNLDAEAVRTCDGFEFRYHQGGTVTWLEATSSHEIQVPVLVGVPVDGWRHLEGCACRMCRKSLPPASARGAAKSSDVVQQTRPPAGLRSPASESSAPR